jgi:hypothetical protein
MTDSRYTGVANLLAPENCTLLLIDHQPSQLASVQNMDRTLLVSGVVEDHQWHRRHHDHTWWNGRRQHRLEIPTPQLRDLLCAL